MTNSTRKKKEQLGINPGTASSMLKKSLLFQMAQKLEMDYCYQCGARIESLDQFSIDHKTPWLDSEDPIKLFFDLDNIAFSHLECNVRAAKRKKAVCGSVNVYKRGCRCDKCRKANSDMVKSYRLRKKHAGMA